MRSGTVSLGYITLRYAGYSAYVWSGFTWKETTNAFYLAVTDRATTSLPRGDRYIVFRVGWSLRLVGRKVLRHVEAF